MTRPRNRFLRILLDALLIPLAVLIVLIEDVLWVGAIRLLHGIQDLGPVQALRVQLERVPASIALPLFLVPETLSHVAGAYATLLLAQGHLVAAILVGVLVKGTCTLILVWIYQCCEETLLRVTWFARLHHTALAIRDWALSQVGPMRDQVRAWSAPMLAAMRSWLARLRGDAAGQPINPRRRFLAWKSRLAVWLRGAARR
jgi:hypothetical protein